VILFLFSAGVQFLPSHAVSPEVHSPGKKSFKERYIATFPGYLWCSFYLPRFCLLSSFPGVLQFAIDSFGFLMAPLFIIHLMSNHPFPFKKARPCSLLREPLSLLVPSPRFCKTAQLPGDGESLICRDLGHPLCSANWPLISENIVLPYCIRSRSIYEDLQVLRRFFWPTPIIISRSTPFPSKIAL